MIGTEYIIAFSMAITNIIKKRISDKNKDIIPLIALIITVVCNILNAFIFGGNISESFKESFISGGVALALFSGGSAIGKVVNNEKK